MRKKLWEDGLSVLGKCLLILSLFTLLFSPEVRAQNYTTVKNASKKTIAAWKRANEFLAREEYPEGIAAFEQLTASEPKFIDGWLLLGELYNEQKMFDKGRMALLQVMMLDPNYSSKSWFFLAESCGSSGRGALSDVPPPSRPGDERDSGKACLITYG